MSKEILYIGKFGFPENAAGIRVFRMGKLMQKSGFSVSFLRLFVPRNEPSQNEIEGLHYTQLFRHRSRLLNWADLLTGRITVFNVKNYLKHEKPDVVILYNDCGFLTKSLIKFCRKQKITLGADVTEWYEQNRSSFEEKFSAKMVDYRIRKLDKKLDFLIAISPFLAEYYRNQGPQIFEIPPLMDSVIFKSGERYRYEDGSRLNLSYAGSPGEKDQLLPLINAIEKINAFGIQVHLDLIGVDKNYVCEKLRSVNYESSGIIAYGRLPHEETLRILQRADYTVLFRENLRYAKAGFSTKFAESLSLGIPIICNSVGGADELLVDSNAGILLKDASEASIYNVIDRLLKKDDDYFKNASWAASALAQKKFLPDAYLKLYEKGQQG